MVVMKSGDNGNNGGGGVEKANEVQRKAKN